MRRPSIIVSVRVPKVGIHAAQVRDGVADEERTAVQRLHAAAATAGLVVTDHRGHVGRDVLGTSCVSASDTLTRPSWRISSPVMLTIGLGEV